MPADPLTNDPLLPADFGQDPFAALTASAQIGRHVQLVVTPRSWRDVRLDESRKTIARASYAIFASQLNCHARDGRVADSRDVDRIRDTSTGRRRDLNGNGIIDPNELSRRVPGDVLGFDPANPLGGNPDRVGDYKVAEDARSRARHGARAASELRAERQLHVAEADELQLDAVRRA